MAILALLFFLVTGLLVWLVAGGKGESCGDGVCNGMETPQSCAGDCAESVRLDCNDDGECDSDEGETPETCPGDCTGDGPPPPPPPRCGDGTCNGGESPQTCSQDCTSGEVLEQPAGRCRDDAFRQTAAALFVDCVAACKADSRDNPVVGLPDQQFISFFGQEDDAGVSTFLFPFPAKGFLTDPRTGDKGNSSWYDDDLEKREPHNLYLSPNRVRVHSVDAEIGKREFDEWFAQPRVRSAEYFIFLGSASKSGNNGNEMSPLNKKLAMKRATAAKLLINEKMVVAGAGGRPQIVIDEDRLARAGLDNVKQDFNKLRQKIEHKVPSRNGRSFNPKRGTLGVNQSSLIIALKCNLSQEIAEFIRVQQESQRHRDNAGR